MFQILIYCLCENCNRPEKSHPPLSQQPPSKVEVLSSPPPPLFENLVGGSTPLQKGGGEVPTMTLDSPQVKWWLISTIKNIVYQLLHELPND